MVIVLLTLAAYMPAMRAGYIWDDNDYVTNNEHLTSLDGLAKIWIPRNTRQYYPLVFTTFWIEHHLWGLAPFGYHLTNILLHALSAVLVWRVLLRLEIPAAWCCAAVFALHPVHVESVAWITERKNVLSCAFYLLSMWCYLRYDEQRADKWYFRSLVLFAMALLSKTVTATLPVALFLIIWYRRGRWSKADLNSLWSFLVVGVGLGLFTAYLERNLVGAQGADWELSIWQRVLVAGRGLWFYAGKLVYPATLTFIYPRWDPTQARPADWIAPVGFLLTVIVLWLGRRSLGRGPLAAVLFFAVTLGPALGFLDVYPFRFSFVADHFQYPASLGILVLAVGAVGRAFGSASAGAWRRIGRATAVIVLATLAVLTWKQCGIYRDAETLWRDTLAKNPRAWMPHFNLGLILHERGDVDQAFEHYLQTVRWRPEHHKAHTVLAGIYTERNDLDQAIKHYRLALKVDPQLPTPNINLGNIYASRGRYDEAVRLYRAALAGPSPPPEADFALANTLLATGDFAGAAEHYRRALAGGPDDAATRANLGMALVQAGEPDQAVTEFQTALRLDAGLSEARLALTGVLSRLGRYGEAVETLRAGLAVSPDHAALAGALAWILSTCPDDSVLDGAEAVRLAEQALQKVGPKDAGALKTLAAAHAQAGNYELALRTARRALGVALSIGDKRLAELIGAEIDHFQERRPYRAPSIDSQ